MYEKAVVLENKNGVLKVKILEKNALLCEKCSVRGLCIQKEGERIINLITKKEIKEGDIIYIKNNEAISILNAFLVFIFPLFLLIFGILLLPNFFKKVHSYLITFLIVTFYFFILSRIEKKLVSRVEFISEEEYIKLNNL